MVSKLAALVPCRVLFAITYAPPGHVVTVWMAVVVAAHARQTHPTIVVHATGLDVGERAPVVVPELLDGDAGLDLLDADVSVDGYHERCFHQFHSFCGMFPTIITGVMSLRTHRGHSASDQYSSPSFGQVTSIGCSVIQTPAQVGR